MTHLMNAIDMEILMHRDAHFGGNFEVMLEYYKEEGVGIMPDFSVEEIKELHQLEREQGSNLSELYLPEGAKEEVAEAKKVYDQLREIYSKKEVDPISLKMSDLILAEEEVPQKEMGALIEEGEKVVAPLIHLLSSPSFYDPLYPGYGRSPIFAAQCLAEIKDERAIPPLFEALGQENFFTDEEIIAALAKFGSPAKTFLLERLKQLPLSKDNEYAAIALSGFTDDPDIAKASLDLLEKEEVLKRPLFASYLVFACTDLIGDADRKRLKGLKDHSSLPSSLKEEIDVVIKNWKKRA